MKPEDYNFRDYDNIEQTSPILEISHALGKFALHYGNTAIFSFGEPYEFMTSIFHNDADLGVMNFYDSDELLEQLRGYRFPEYFEPLPDASASSEYFTYQSQVLEAELQEFSGVVSDDEIDDDDEPPEGHTAWDWGFED